MLIQKLNQKCEEGVGNHGPRRGLDELDMVPFGKKTYFQVIANFNINFLGFCIISLGAKDF